MCRVLYRSDNEMPLFSELCWCLHESGLRPAVLCDVQIRVSLISLCCMKPSIASIMDNWTHSAARQTELASHNYSPRSEDLLYRFCLVCVCVCVCVSVRPSVRLSVRARMSVRGFLPPSPTSRWWRAVRSSFELILVYT